MSGWKIKNSFWSLFVEFLSELQHVDFCSGGRLQETGKIKTIPSYYIPKLFFEAVFENPSPKLDTVCIRMDKSTKLDGCVLDIAPYFSSDHHAEASKNRSLPIGTPYSGLKNIHIFGWPIEILRSVYQQSIIKL